MKFESRAPVDLAFAWLSDLAEGDHSGPAFTERRRAGTVVSREILEMSPHEAVVKDVWGKQTIYTRARFFPGDRIEYEWGESPERFRPWTVWRFDPGAGGHGCVITVEFMEGVSAGIARSSADGVRRDAEKHIREMEDEVVAREAGPHREAVVRKDLTGAR
jgi:hypothetical protein